MMSGVARMLLAVVMVATRKIYAGAAFGSPKSRRQVARQRRRIFPPMLIPFLLHLALPPSGESLS